MLIYMLYLSLVGTVTKWLRREEKYVEETELGNARTNKSWWLKIVIFFLFFNNFIPFSIIFSIFFLFLLRLPCIDRAKVNIHLIHFGNAHSRTIEILLNFLFSFIKLNFGSSVRLVILRCVFEHHHNLWTVCSISFYFIRCWNNQCRTHA